MIILNSKKIKKNFKEMLVQYQNQEFYGPFECPHCHHEEFEKWGSYKRNINYVNHGSMVYTVLLVKRIRCKHCERTHALLPSFIVPYKQNTLDVILKAISDDIIIVHHPFSIDTINYWKHQFSQLFLPYIKTIFKNSIDIIHQILNDIFNYYIEYEKKNKNILMMARHGIYSMTYF